MAALERIREAIPQFPGYDGEAHRRLADEQIRAYAGERLAALPRARLDALKPEARQQYDALLTQVEFTSTAAFGHFEYDPTQPRIDALLDADVQVIDACSGMTANSDLDANLTQIAAAFDRRDAVMRAV